MGESRTEREQSRRCQSSFEIVPGHTHLCRLNHAHVVAEQQHECICEIKWAPVTQENE